MSFTSLRHHLHLHMLPIIGAEVFQPFPGKFTVSFWSKRPNLLIYPQIAGNAHDAELITLKITQLSTQSNHKKSSEFTSSFEGGKGAALFKSPSPSKGKSGVKGFSWCPRKRLQKQQEALMADTKNKLLHLHSISQHKQNTGTLGCGLASIFDPDYGEVLQAWKSSPFDSFN